MRPKCARWHSVTILCMLAAAFGIPSAVAQPCSAMLAQTDADTVQIVFNRVNGRFASANIPAPRLRLCPPQWYAIAECRGDLITIDPAVINQTKKYARDHG